MILQKGLQWFTSIYALRYISYPDLRSPSKSRNLFGFLAKNLPSGLKISNHCNFFAIGPISKKRMTLSLWRASSLSTPDPSAAAQLIQLWSFRDRFELESSIDPVFQHCWNLEMVRFQGSACHHCYLSDVSYWWQKGYLRWLSWCLCIPKPDSEHELYSPKKLQWFENFNPEGNFFARNRNISSVT